MLQQSKHQQGHATSSLVPLDYVMPIVVELQVGAPSDCYLENSAIHVEVLVGWAYPIFFLFTLFYFIFFLTFKVAGE